MQKAASLLRLSAALLLALTLSGGPAPEVCAQEPRRVLIGLVNNNEPGFRAEVLAPTLSHLRRALPNVDFRTVDIAAYKAVEDVQRTHPDFVIAPSDVFMLLLEYGSQPMAVRKSSRAEDANSSLGSTLVVLKSRDDISSLADLKGRTASASLPDSLGGYLALAGELKANGFDPDRFFGSVRFRTFQIPDVVADVLEGRADAGILSTCQIEAAEEGGLMESGRLKVINARTTPGFSCAHSTALYPDQIFGSARPDVPPDILKSVSLALLQMPEHRTEGTGPDFSWQVAGRFDSIHALYRTLEIGPWAYLKDRTLSGLFMRYRTEILIALGILIFLALNEIRLVGLVKRRTAKLQTLVAEKEAMVTEVRRMAGRLTAMERNSLVSQMSSVIAHELKQPIASIINYSDVIAYELEESGEENGRLAQANASIDREAHRISSIIDHVRSYVKKTERHHETCDLSELAAKAIRSFGQYSESAAVSLKSGLQKNVPISADPLEIEILVLNLLKNAARAAGKVKEGEVSVRTSMTAGRAVLEVSDNGPALPDEAFRRLREAADATGNTSAEGLGLGLSIVRSIIDEHSATLRIERLVPNGILMEVSFDSVKGETK